MAEMEKAVGGVSNAGKMPWMSFNLPAEACNTGGVLQGVSGSVCGGVDVDGKRKGGCYALCGAYLFKSTVQAMLRRLIKIRYTNLDVWVDDMTELITRKACNVNPDKRFFRWHDSGDVQSYEHLIAIVEIAKRCPDIGFWLPTKEYKLYSKLIRSDISIPSNLVIRVSGTMLDRLPTGKFALTSTVSFLAPSTGFECPATRERHTCDGCRACWNADVENVDYRFHFNGIENVKAQLI
jgi:hypothetical protein